MAFAKDGREASPVLLESLRDLLSRSVPLVLFSSGQLNRSAPSSGFSQSVRTPPAALWRFPKRVPNASESRWGIANLFPNGQKVQWQIAKAVPNGSESTWQFAQDVRNGSEWLWQFAQGLPNGSSGHVRLPKFIPNGSERTWAPEMGENGQKDQETRGSAIDSRARSSRRDILRPPFHQNTRLRGLVLGLVAVYFVSSGCVVKRLGRPQLTGYVYDAETGLPLAGCSVGEVQTDADGYFELPRRCYREMTFVGREAPPLMVSELVEMTGYETVHITGFSTFGGSNCSDGSDLEIEPIYLGRSVADGRGAEAESPREVDLWGDP